MTLATEFDDMCHDTIVVTPPLNAASSTANATAYGVSLHSTASSTYECRIVGKPKNVISKDGDAVVSMAQIIVMADVKIDPRSSIVLSSVANGCSSTPPIINVTYYPDAESGGLSHPTVYV